MSYLILALAILCSFTILVDILLIYYWSFHRKSFDNESEGQPKVSILIAARNEEGNLPACLDSLLKISYPIDELEILIGDDQSEDDTYQIADSFARRNEHIRVLRIEKQLGTAKGKANVLAHLAKEATGEIFLITDADILVPENWVQSMLHGVDNDNVGIVNGVTAVSDNNWQNIDWLFALGMVKVINDVSQPVTAMGNNMLITRKAYEAVGGYESIPFSVTEDFELFKYVRKKGLAVNQLFSENVLAFTKGQKGFLSLLNQRKRWMMGAVQLPWPVVTLLTLQALYFPSLITLFFLNAEFALVLAGMKMLIQATFILMLVNHLSLKVPFFKALLYEIYSMVISLSSGLFYLLPIKITWKGRKY